MSSDGIDKIFQILSIAFLGAIVGGALQSIGDMVYALVMVSVLIVLLALTLVYINRREKEISD